MFVKRYSVTLTTDSSGDGELYTDAMNGRVLQMIVVPSATAAPPDNYHVDIFSGVDSMNFSTPFFAWTEASAATTRIFNPRVATHDSTMTAALYAGAGEPVLSELVLANEPLYLAIEDGGDTKSLTIHFYVG